jgi:hypothetical protein
MDLFTNGGVDAGIQIAWHLRAPRDEFISIIFGDEQITLDFHDVESLERLRDIADQAALRLRAVYEANAATRTGELVGAGKRSGQVSVQCQPGA